jgi:hypothetical protein
MSLKEEIEKLIKTEQQELERADHLQDEFRKRQRERFKPMLVLLQELLKSIDNTYLKINIREDSASIEVDEEEENILPDIRWNIEPNFEIDMSRENISKGLFFDVPGFRVEEIRSYEYPDYDVTEKTKIFTSVTEVGEYLIQNIAKQIAGYRHRESKK